MRAAATRRAQLVTGTCLAAAAAFFPCADARAQNASPFRPERFDEDWSAAAEEGAPFGAQFKDLQVAPGVTVSFGGDARWRFSAMDAPRLGLGGAEADEWLLQRLLLHADARFDENARLFVQLGAHEGVGRKIPSSSDDNGVDVQQAFIDLNAPVGEAHATLRVGRQELVLGPRIATARDTGNVRQRHDLVRLIYKWRTWRADVFAGSPVNDGRGAFDDRADQEQEFYGVRVQRALGATTVEAYAYELDRNTVSLTGMTANDDRVSLGARVAGRIGAYDFDAEAVYQTGSFGSQEIRALGSALDFGRRFADAPGEPRVGARFTYGSGDADLGDTTQGTFAPPFASASWFGQNGLASYSNVIEAAATLNLSPRENVSVNLKVAGMWRSETADYVYAGSASLAGTSGGDDAFVGVTPAALLIWRVSDNVSIMPYASYVFVGDELQSRGADNVAYAHLGVSVRF